MKKKNMKTNNSGFSLVELIIVIAIMAVLVGVLAPQFIKYVERSRQSTDIQNIDEVATALRTYYADNEDLGIFDITLSHTAVPTGSGTPALADAGIDTYKLKSSKWNSSSVSPGSVSSPDGQVKISLDVSTGKVTKSGAATTYAADGTK